MNFIDSIIPIKKKEVYNLKKKRLPNRFAQLFEGAELVVIAEIKPQSPSAGKLITGDPLELVAAYERGGAHALSVLTDEKFFGGTPGLFRKIRSSTQLPLLRKEFIIDESQVVETFEMAADAILLIVKIVSSRKLESLIEVSKLLGLVPLVEINSSEELAIALKAGADYIGVNSRNLQTLEVNNQRALDVLSEVPPGIHKLLFSGIDSPEQIRAAQDAGAQGVLIGTSLLKASDPTEKLRLLREGSKR